MPPSTDNPNYMSQFPDTKLGNALRTQVEIRHEFYKEYVTQDHNHEYISKISQTAAMALVQSSPYRPFLTSYMINNEAYDDLNKTPRHIMNKGAIRIIPTAEFRDVLKGIHKLTEASDENHELWDRYRGWLADFYKMDQDRYELWVYNHDGKYYLTRPRRKPLQAYQLNERLHNILKCIQRSEDDGFRDAALNGIRHIGDELLLTEKDCDEINKHLGIGYWMHPNGKWTY